MTRDDAHALLLTRCWFTLPRQQNAICGMSNPNSGQDSSC